jgi:hypothetical protein
MRIKPEFGGDLHGIRNETFVQNSVARRSVAVLPPKLTDRSGPNENPERIGNSSVVSSTTWQQFNVLFICETQPTSTATLGHLPANGFGVGSAALCQRMKGPQRFVNDYSDPFEHIPSTATLKSVGLPLYAIYFSLTDCKKRGCVVTSSCQF